MIYLAAPLFTKAEQDFGFALTARLEDAGHEVYFPWRDAGDDELFERFAGDVPQINREIVLRNLDAIRRCARVVAVCEGADVECGTAMEIGYAHAMGKPVACLRTDFRTQGARVGPMNIMITEIAADVHATIDALLEALEAGPAPVDVSDLATFYDAVAGEYGDGEAHPFTACSKRVEEQRSRAAVEGRRFDTALDLACGDGGFLLHVDARLRIGVDLSPGMLQVHRRRLPSALYILGDAAHTGLPEDSVDVAHSSFLLDHLADPGALLDEVDRVVRPGGLVLLAFHEPDSLVRWRGTAHTFLYHGRDGRVYRVPSDPTVLEGIGADLERRFALRSHERLALDPYEVAVEHYVLEVR